MYWHCTLLRWWNLACFVHRVHRFCLGVVKHASSACALLHGYAYIFSHCLFTQFYFGIYSLLSGGIRFKLLFGCKSQPNNLTWLIKDDIDAVNAYRAYTHLCLVLVITTQHFVHVPRTFICLVEFNVSTVIAVSNFVVKSTCECTKVDKNPKTRPRKLTLPTLIIIANCQASVCVLQII